MGCWNKTCGLSNLHIRAGDPVYVFVLEKLDDKDLDGFCYSTAFYRPLLLPFASEYNDYGGGQNSSGPAFGLVMDAIKKKLVEMPQGENQYHDIAVTKEKFGEDLFFDAVHENRLSINYGKFHGETTLNFVMFRRDIVDSILENWQREVYVGQGLGTCGWDNNYRRHGFQEILADLPEFIDRVSAYLTDKEKLIDFGFFDSLGIVFKRDESNLVAKWLRSDGYRYSRLVEIKQVIIDLLTEDRRQELETVLTEYLKGVYIDCFMHMTRKSWIPGAHEGSQSQEHHGYRVLIAAVNQALDRERQEYEQETNEEFSEF